MSVTACTITVVGRLSVPRSLCSLAGLQFVVKPVEVVEARLLGEVGHGHCLDAAGVDRDQDLRRRPGEAQGGKPPGIRHPARTGIVVRHKLDDCPLQACDVVLRRQLWGHWEAYPPKAIEAIGGHEQGPAMAEPRWTTLAVMKDWKASATGALSTPPGTALAA